MDERLQALIRLQQLDEAIARRNEQLNALPIRLQAAEGELERAQKILEDLHRDLFEVQKEADLAELKLRSAEANISKLEAQRLAVKTNREYQAITAQIGGAKADNSRLEDQILTLNTKIEQVQKACREQEAEVERLRARRDEVAAATREEAQRLEEELADLHRKSQEARRAVPGEALEVYDRLRGRLGGPPLAAVREEVCTGCNMAVSPQTISLLRLGRDLVQCTSCTRILYLDGDAS